MQSLGCAKSGMLLKGKSVAFLSPFLYPSFGNMVKIVRMIFGRRMDWGGGNCVAEPLF